MTSSVNDLNGVPFKEMLLQNFIILLLILNGNLHAVRAYKLNDPPPICSPYEMLIVNAERCVSRCPLRCSRGLCYEDGVCPCANSYMTSLEDGGLVCARTCLPGCIEAGGYCATTELCLCPGKGLHFDPIARKCQKRAILQHQCEWRCIYGLCDERGNCNCSKGFRRNNNLFGQLCTPVCRQDCGRKGYCFLPNMCACRKHHYHYQSDGLCHKEDDYTF